MNFFINLFKRKGGNIQEAEILVENTLEIQDTGELTVLLPTFSEEFNIIKQHDSIVGKAKLNLNKMECSCSDFKKRIEYKIGDIRRMCIHLRREYRESKLGKELSTLEKTLISNNYGDKDSIYISEDMDFAITFDMKTDAWFSWYNVIACNDKGRHICYTFNPMKGMWGKDKIPANSLYIESVVKAIEESVQTIMIIDDVRIVNSKYS